VATIRKRKRADGYRYTARVRIRGQQATRTFTTKAAAERWAAAQETAFRDGQYAAPRGSGPGSILADVIDDFITERGRLRRPPGKTFHAGLLRIKNEHGLEHVAALHEEFWKRHALKRIEKGASGSTVASELTYIGTVFRWFAKQPAGKLHRFDVQAPSAARAYLRDQGVSVVSRQRTKRISDAEIAALRKWIAENAARTKLPLADLFEFALATGLRRGELLALEWENVEGRVLHIRRKHPRERDRMEDVPLLKAHAVWPQVDPLAIIERQPKGGRRIFPYVADTVSFWFEQACAGADVTGAVFHLLRHECLSRLAERGFDPLRLALVGGHRDLRNVKRYAKLDAARLANE
jgi:integrase